MIHFASVYAALLSPRGEDGAVDANSLRAQFKSLKGQGLVGYALNGATGEFTVTSEDELELTLAVAREMAPDAEILCGIGAGDVRGAVSRGKLAAKYGSKGVLLPMPYFFPYRQDDLKAFVLAVASEVEVPVLLYNLPQFTSGLEVATALDLMNSHNNIVGIKDSSGSLDIVRAMTDAGMKESRIIGNDSALCDALRGRLCDGVVSGVACTLPELMAKLFALGAEGKDFGAEEKLLDDFIAQINVLPTPWGLKVTSAVRGFTRESYPLPMSAERKVEAQRIRDWFAAWHKASF